MPHLAKSAFNRPESGIKQCYVMNKQQTWCRIEVLWRLQATENHLACPCGVPCDEDIYYISKLSTSGIISRKLYNLD